MSLKLFSFPYCLYSKPQIPPKQYPIQRGSHNTHKIWRTYFSATTSIPHSLDERRSAIYQPTSWSYDFLQSLKNDQEYNNNNDKAKKLEEKVKCMISCEDADFLTTFELIDDIQRLGLGYLFEKDIKRALDRFISFRKSVNVEVEKNLHATSLSFRLLRQHGYEVSQDMFKAFKDSHGNFMTSLCKDVKGMLSLYEASQLAFEGEDILVDALAFTSLHLKVANGSNLDSVMAELITHTLELPLHRRMLRLEARWYIDAYSKRKGANLSLLELAKLDFNKVQATHQMELQDMSRWWKNMDLANKLPFARDRLMECFFWCVGVVFEPQFIECRKGLTKVTSLITTIDDVYDVYGTIEELELFTDAVDRWDISATEDLPNYMKLCFLALYNTVNEMTYDTLKNHGENPLPYLTKVWADLCKAFLQEAKWSHNKRTPKFGDYFENAWVSVSGVVILVHAYFLMGQDINKQALECLRNCHDLIRWPSIIFRLCNDLGTSKAELERGESASSILCYMHETGVSEEFARKYVRDLTDQNWKMLNKERFRSDSPFAKYFQETAVNLARISECTYQHGDSHGAPDDRSKNRVLSLLIEPCPVS